MLYCFLKMDNLKKKQKMLLKTKRKLLKSKAAALDKAVVLFYNSISIYAKHIKEKKEARKEI